MKRFFALTLAALSALPVMLNADVTIRYKVEMSSPMTPQANRSDTEVIYMKGNRGVMAVSNEITIADFGRQEVTVIDTVRKKYATVPAAEYGKWIAESMMSSIPQAPGAADMLKSMKTTCETRKAAAPETIQGVQSEERDVTCTMTMPMPASMSAVMPDMGMKMVMRVWSASESERVRVPGLWQLSGFELWQKYFMNPTASLSKMVPGGAAELAAAIGNGQFATMRSSMEMSMKMPMPGMAAGETPLMKMNTEVASISTELLDDSLFSVPGDCSAEPFDVLMKGIMAAAIQGANVTPARLPGTSPGRPIPPRVKAYVPDLAPLTQKEPLAQVDSKGNKVPGIVEVLLIVGPRGAVQEAEALSGPEELRKPAVDAVRRWTFRPVLRDGKPVAAYTETDVFFSGDLKNEAVVKDFAVEPDILESAERQDQLAQVFPRSPEQELADVEQDSGGGDTSRRHARLPELAMKAAEVKANDKAKAYANELLSSPGVAGKDWNYGNAIHTGHIVLGLVALHSGDIQTARAELLEAGRAPGSPLLDAIGPNMTLASELLAKGERDTVIQYLELTRKSWKTGGARLDSMIEAIRQGRMLP